MQEKRWNRPDVLHCSWPLYFHCTVAALKIVLARGSCDIFSTQRLAFDRSSGDIVLPQRLVLHGVPMISFSSFFFALF